MSVRSGRGRRPTAKSQRVFSALVKTDFYSEWNGESVPDLDKGVTWSVVYVLEGPIWPPYWGQCGGTRRNKTPLRRLLEQLGRERDDWETGYSASGEKQLNSYFILKTEPTGLADRLDVGCERWEESKMTLKTKVLSNRKEPPLMEMV